MDPLLLRVDNDGELMWSQSIQIVEATDVALHMNNGEHRGTRLPAQEKTVSRWSVNSGRLGGNDLCSDFWQSQRGVEQFRGLTVETLN